MKTEREPKTQIAIVVSKKTQKTFVVKVENRYPHPIYSKTLVKTKKYLVDMPFSYRDCISVGDKVKIYESKPRSKRKRWALCRLIKN